MKNISSLCRYCRNEPDDNITDSKSFKSKSSFTNNIDDDGILNVRIAVQIKYIGRFWRIIEISLTYFEIYTILNWWTNCVICKADRATNCGITDTKIYIPVVTL